MQSGFLLTLNRRVCLKYSLFWAVRFGYRMMSLSSNHSLHCIIACVRLVPGHSPLGGECFVSSMWFHSAGRVIKRWIKMNYPPQSYSHRCLAATALPLLYSEISWQRLATWMFSIDPLSLWVYTRLATIPGQSRCPRLCACMISFKYSDRASVFYRQVIYALKMYINVDG